MLPFHDKITTKSNIGTVGFTCNYAVSKNHKPRIRAKHRLHSFGVDIVTTDLLAAGKRMEGWAGYRLWGEADNCCILCFCLLNHRSEALFATL
jgi:hypothetical protein